MAGPSTSQVDPGALVAALDDAVDQQHQARRWRAARRRSRSGPGSGSSTPGRAARSLPHAGGGERHVDQEDRAPPEVGQQQPADDRADRHRRCRPPMAQMPMARGRSRGSNTLVMIDRVCGMTAARAEAHRGPGPDQLVGGLRVGAEQREQAEQRPARSISIRLRPIRSPITPKVNSSPAKTSV